MALNLTNLFTSLGCVGRNAVLIDTAQAAQPYPFDDLVDESWVNPSWTAALASSYDTTLRSSSGEMAAWTQTATTILQQLVAEQAPVYGSTLSGSLQYLLEVMEAQSATVAECDIGSTVAADAENTGTGVVVVSTTRYDGLTFQNVIAEQSALLITRDSYTGGATAGQEPWTWNGAPNVSSLQTGVSVGTWDFDWPQGSNGSASGSAISASQDATTNGNLLTNGDCEDWTTGTPSLNYWYLAVGTWGTSIQRSSTALGGSYSIQFNAGATLNALTQQFNSTSVTGATSGTDVEALAFTPYMVNFWTRASGVISGGVLTVSLVDSTGTVLQNHSGVNQSQTLALTGLSTSWTARSFSFQTPVQLPTDGIVRLKIAITTALAGANLLIDDICMVVPTSLYTGGPYVAVFSNPAVPFVAAPNPDGFTLTFTNDRAGAAFGATFQTLFSRLFQTPELILPYSSTPTLEDSLITDPQGVFSLLGPADLTVNTNGLVVDCDTFPTVLNVVQNVGGFTDALSFDGKMQESSTGVGAWTDVVGGAFAAVTASNDVQRISIVRTKRYLRWICTITPDGSPLIYCSVTGDYEA